MFWHLVSTLRDIMGYDHRADCNGVFEISITKYDHGEEIEHVLITGLEPYQKLGLEVVVGGSR
jgi:hypothetical protein